MVWHRDKLIVGLTGMPGSGKDAALSRVKDFFQVYRMGDIVIEEAKRRNLEITTENIGNIATELRNKEGPGAIASRLVDKIYMDKIEGDIIFINGIRSMYEVEIFKKHFKNFFLINIHASPETRFKRVLKRKREDDAVDRKIFDEKDKRELSWGLGDVIALADRVIENEATEEELMRRFRDLLLEISSGNTRKTVKKLFSDYDDK